MKNIIMLLLIIFLPILFGICMMLGEIKIDRNWHLIKCNNFTRILVLLVSVPIFYITYSAFSTYLVEKVPNIFVLIILAGMSTMFLLAINEVFRTKIWFDKENIFYQSPYGKKIVMRFDDIITCIQSKSGEYYMVEDYNNKIKISIFMPGSIDLVKYIQYRIGK